MENLNGKYSEFSLTYPVSPVSLIIILPEWGTSVTTDEPILYIIMN